MIHSTPISAAARLAAMARTILPDGVAVTGEELATTSGRNLHPQEALFLAGMVPKRQREFIGGRVAAHRAMAALGQQPAPVLAGADRAPVWPKGFVGSITHTESVALALIAGNGNFRSLAVDLEPDTPLPADLLTDICLPAERAWLHRHPAADQGRLARLIFSAKECAYKAQYPLTGLLFGFDRFSVSIDRAGNRFQAVFTRTTGEFSKGCALSGRFLIANGFILTTLALATTGTKE